MDINTYKTQDLYEASLLYAKRIPLLELIWNGKQCSFVFKDKKTLKGSLCEELSNKFWNGNLSINCTDYVSAIKHLKERLFSKK
jgi:hypothetical protein